MLDNKLIIILEWITANWFPNIPAEVRNLILRTWTDLIRKWISNQGVPHTIKRIKFIRLTVTRYLCGQPLMVNDLMIGVTSDGYPSSILFMRDLIDSSDPQYLRFALTLLGISRAMKADGKVSYNSITDPFKGEVKTLPKDFINLFVKDFCPTMEDSKITVRERFHSLDLSAATDRFPIDLQVDLIDSIELAGNKPYRGIGKAWKSLMVKEPFLTPEGDLLRYAVGQPMGARSSWAAFTLSHHLVVQYAAHVHGLYPFKEYILLGDDIVIYNDIVAEEYVRTIELLGVECSPAKSHTSENTYEFAKRWFRNGIEISPVPLKGFLANWANPVLLFQDILTLVYNLRGPRSGIQSVQLAIDLIKRLGYTRSQIRLYTSMFTDIRFIKRVTMDFPDFQLLRNFLGAASVGNDYILPFGEATLLKEFNRTSSLVVNGMVMTVCNTLSKYYQSFKNSFESFITAPSGIINVDELFKIHPLSYALYSSVYTFEEMNKELGYTLDLNRQLTTVTVLDLEKLSYQSRTSVDMIFTYRTFARKLRLAVEFDPYQLVVKAQGMRFGRSLMDIRLAFQKDNPLLKTGMLTKPLVLSSLDW